MDFLKYSEWLYDNGYILEPPDVVVTKYYRHKIERMSKIEEIVCKHFDISVQAVYSRIRIDRVCIARCFIWKFCRESLFMTLEEIGKQYDKIHPTIISGIKRIDGLIEVDENFKSHYETLEKLINNK